MILGRRSRVLWASPNARQRSCFQGSHRSGILVFSVAFDTGSKAKGYRHRCMGCAVSGVRIREASLTTVCWCLRRQICRTSRELSLRLRLTNKTRKRKNMVVTCRRDRADIPTSIFLLPACIPTRYPYQTILPQGIRDVVPCHLLGSSVQESYSPVQSEACEIDSVCGHAYHDCEDSLGHGIRQSTGRNLIHVLRLSLPLLPNLGM